MLAFLGQDNRVYFSIKQKVRIMYLLILCRSRHLFQGLIAHRLSGWDSVSSYVSLLAEMGDGQSYIHSPLICWSLVIAWKVVLTLSLLPEDALGIMPYCQISPYCLHIAISQFTGKCESFDELLRDCVFFIFCYNESKQVSLGDHILVTISVSTILGQLYIECLKYFSPCTFSFFFMQVKDLVLPLLREGL